MRVCGCGVARVGLRKSTNQFKDWLLCFFSLSLFQNKTFSEIGRRLRGWIWPCSSCLISPLFPFHTFLSSLFLLFLFVYFLIFSSPPFPRLFAPPILKYTIGSFYIYTVLERERERGGTGTERELSRRQAVSLCGKGLGPPNVFLPEYLFLLYLLGSLSNHAFYGAF